MAQHGRRLRDRITTPSITTRTSTGMLPRAQGFGVLPTPDPTIASCISDEDVALQLMRLGDASNISHGRTSASTLDDALSGRADAASSVTSQSEDEDDNTEQPSLPMPRGQPKVESGPPVQLNRVRKHHKQLNDGFPSTGSADPSDDEIDGDYMYDEKRDGVSKSELDDISNENGQPMKSKSSGSKPRNNARPSSIISSKKSSKISKSKLASHAKKTKLSSLSTATKGPLSPASQIPQSRKTSSASTLNFQHQGEEDLSSKPRCQRCRKSKKGCDRQRPCQRCKDAGIGADGCISEDEGNGRKGRFGRHMGVSVKKDALDQSPQDEAEEAGAILDVMASSPEKSRKRKR